MVKEGKKITGPEQLKDAAYGCARIRGDTLGIVGLGTFLFTLSVCRSVKFSSKTQHTDALGLGELRMVKLARYVLVYFVRL